MGRKGAIVAVITDELTFWEYEEKRMPKASQLNYSDAYLKSANISV